MQLASLASSNSSSSRARVDGAALPGGCCCSGAASGGAARAVTCLIFVADSREGDRQSWQRLADTAACAVWQPLGQACTNIRSTGRRRRMEGRMQPDANKIWEHQDRQDVSKIDSKTTKFKTMIRSSFRAALNMTHRASSRLNCVSNTYKPGMFLHTEPGYLSCISAVPCRIVVRYQLSVTSVL